MTAPATVADDALVSGQTNPDGLTQISVWAGPGARQVVPLKTNETGIIGARRVDHANATDYGHGAPGIEYFLTDPDGLLIRDIGGLIAIDVLGNDLPGGTGVTDRINSASLAIVTKPADGLAISYQSRIWFAPHCPYEGADAFTYTVANDAGQTSAATTCTLLIETAGAPTPRPIALAVMRGTTVAIAAGQAFDSAEFSQTIQLVEVVTPPVHGITQVSGDTVLYAADAVFIGIDSFAWRMLIDGIWSTTGTVTLQVGATIVRPDYKPSGDQIIHPAESVRLPHPQLYATPAAGTARYQTPVTINLLAHDLRQGGIKIQSVTAPAHGTIVDHEDGTITYTPAAGFTGLDTFSYSVTDNINVRSARVSVTTLAPTIIATPDYASAIAELPTVIEVLSNDIGTDLRVTAVSNPTHGTAVVVDGSKIQYQADQGFAGTETFFYTITDVSGHTANGMITVEVLATPIILDSPSVVTSVGIPVLVPIVPDNAVGTGLTVTAVGAPTSGLATTSVSGGGVNYLPQPTFAGPDSFTVTVTDSFGASATATAAVVVQPATIAVKADAATTQVNTAVVIRPLDNDTGSGLAVTAVSTPAHGGAAVTDNGQTVTYTPTTSFVGSDSFTYTATDQVGQSGAAQIKVEVTATASPVAAVDDEFHVFFGTTQTLPVLNNDSDPANLTISAIGSTSHGGSAVPTSDKKQIIYTPAVADDETFTYTVTNGISFSTATVTVEVGVDLPIANPDTYSATAGVLKTLTPLDNDSGTGLSIVSTTSLNATAIDTPAGPRTALNYTAPPTFEGAEEFSYVISNADGEQGTGTITVNVTKIPFAPQPDTYQISSAGGIVTTANLTVGGFAFESQPDTPPPTPQDIAITFAPLSNDGGSNPALVAVGSTDWVRSTVVLNEDVVPAVVAVDDPGLTAVVGQAKLFDVLANDTPTAVGPALAIKAGSITGFTHGGSAVISGTKISYTAAAEGAESFTYIATNTITEDIATVGVIVSPAPVPVVANPDPPTGTAAFPATVGIDLDIDVLANDTPMPGLLVNTVTQGTRGDVSIVANKARYRGRSAGADTFTYTAKDAATPPQVSPAAQVRVQVAAAPPPVNAVNDGPPTSTTFAAFAVKRGVQTLLPVLANDTPAGVLIKAGSITGISAGGSVTINTARDRVVYKSSSTFTPTGNETFNYIATNGVTEDPALVTVQVTVPPGGSTPFNTIGLTRTGTKLVTPTTAQLKNIQQNNADADVQGLKNVTAYQNNVDATLDLRGRKFYHHSMVRWTGDNNQPRRKNAIRLSGSTIKSGLSIYGAEFIGQQTDGPGTPAIDNWADLTIGNATATPDPTADDNAIVFDTLSATSATFYVEHCVFRKNTDGINTFGPSPNTGKNRFIVRECYAEKVRDDFIDNNTLQLLEVYGCLIDSCHDFLSMRPITGSTAVAPGYGTRANRVKLEGVLARCRGQYFTRLATGSVYKPFAKRTAQWKDDNSLVTTGFTISGTTPGWAHEMPFKGRGLDTSGDFTSSPWVDAKNCVFAFESQAFTLGPIRMPPGDYLNCFLCFLPDLAVGATNPSRNDFLDPTWGPRTGLTVQWGAAARTTWFDARSDWLNSRGAVLLADGSYDFPTFRA